MGARIDVVAVVVVSLCSARDLLRGRIGWFWRAHSHARGGFVLMICQQGSHYGHDGKVCEQGRPKNLTRRIFHNTQMASPGSPNWTNSQYLKGVSVQCRETREHTR